MQQNHVQISHQILVFITREFTKSTKQPTRSQELRSTELMFVLLVRHGRQRSEKMHPKKVVMIKRVSSVDGIMGIREEESTFKKNPREIIYSQPTLFDNTFGGQSGQRTVWSCLS